jgi:DNA-directed RNA polymerase II subunit RPB7
MLNFLESKLYSDVEGTCSGQFGYIIAVVSILDIGKGMVLSGSGQAEFITRYRAIVFKPFKGEVVDGVVNNVTKVRHPVEQKRAFLTSEQMGFFADVGPLTVFVSHQVRAIALASSCFTERDHVQLIHPDMRFDPNSNPPSFASEEQVMGAMSIQLPDILTNIVIDH